MKFIKKKVASLAGLSRPRPHSPGQRQRWLPRPVHRTPPPTRRAPGCGTTARSRAATADHHRTGDYFEQVLDGYFQGWRDGYAQALGDVDTVIDGIDGSDN